MRWPALWALVILTLTSLPGSLVPSAGAIPNADKIAHFLVYSVFGVFLMRAQARDVRQTVAIRVLIAVAIFAALDEWHQQFIPGRDMDLLDWLADTAGAAAGVIGFLMARKRRERTT